MVERMGAGHQDPTNAARALSSLLLRDMCKLYSTCGVKPPKKLDWRRNRCQLHQVLVPQLLANRLPGGIIDRVPASVQQVSIPGVRSFTNRVRTDFISVHCINMLRSRAFQRSPITVGTNTVFTIVSAPRELTPVPCISTGVRHPQATASAGQPSKQPVPGHSTLHEYEQDDPTLVAQQSQSG